MGQDHRTEGPGVNAILVVLFITKPSWRWEVAPTQILSVVALLTIKRLPGFLRSL